MNLNIYSVMMKAIRIVHEAVRQAWSLRNGKVLITGNLTTRKSTISVRIRETWEHKLFECTILNTLNTVQS